MAVCEQNMPLTIFSNRSSDITNDFNVYSTSDHNIKHSDRTLSTKRYLHEEDKFKEFLVGYRQGDDGHNGALHTLEEWNRQWDNFNLAVKLDQGALSSLRSRERTLTKIIKASLSYDKHSINNSLLRHTVTGNGPDCWSANLYISLDKIALEVSQPNDITQGLMLRCWPIRATILVDQDSGFP